MKKAEFLKEVAHEIEQLKLHATQEEIEKLSYGSFDPDNTENCIYGQMTGVCDSKRAKELMDKACIRVFDFKGLDNCIERGVTFMEVKKFVNGKYQGQTWERKVRDHNRSFNFFSALEGYICLKDAKVKNIIDYLKGKVETLEL